jgi:hypothetical protein
MEHLESALEALQLAKYDVDFDLDFGMSKVVYDKREYYIKDIKVGNIPASTIEDRTITVCDDEMEYTITITPEKPVDERTNGYFGFSAYKSFSCVYVGHLIDNNFTTYIGKWCKIDSYITRINGPEGYNYEEEVLTNSDDKVIMNTDFTPAAPVKLEGMTNKGLKYVCGSNLDYTSLEFSIIGYQFYKFIVKDLIVLVNDGPYQYAREGERLSMLWDPINLETMLINNKNEEVEMEKLLKYTVKKTGSHYNGHKIITDISEFGEDGGEPTVFCYNGIFFAQNDNTGEIVKLIIETE